jgi:SET domain-containing protein
MTYKPLPANIYLNKSDIHGMGLYAGEEIKKGHEFGITHVYDEDFENGYIRTPLGGFFNHSEDPNCEAYVSGRYIKLRAIKDIMKDEELTAYYWLYEMGMDDSRR